MLSFLGPPQVGSLEDLRMAFTGKLWIMYVDFCHIKTLGEEVEEQEGSERGEVSIHPRPSSMLVQLTFVKILFLHLSTVVSIT